jgi:hypothetical protein
MRTWVDLFLESERQRAWALMFSVGTLVACICILFTLSVTRTEIRDLKHSLEKRGIHVAAAV